MINLKKASKLIKEDGLFSFIYDDMKIESGKNQLEVEEIQELLSDSSIFIEEYKRLNRENKISNIEINSLIIDASDNENQKNIKTNINKNLDELKTLEKYDTPSKYGLQFIWIGSVAVGLIFVVHNIVSIFTELYSKMGYVVFSLYGLIIACSIIVLLKSNKSHDTNYRRFKKIYDETKALINTSLKNDHIQMNELFD